MVLDLSERISSASPCLASIGEFMECVQDLCLTDANASGFFYTWWNKQESGELVLCKLNRVLQNPTWLASRLSLNAHFAEPGVSDHSWMELEVGGISKRRGPGFKFLNAWADHQDFLRFVEEGWNQSAVGCAMFRVVTRLKSVGRNLHKLHKTHFTSIANGAHCIPM